jgi:predicted DNA-binding transcriptional regulator AlpA
VYPHQSVKIRIKNNRMKELNINTKLIVSKDYLTIEDLTEVFKVSQYTIYRICNKGELKPIKFMRRNYWKSNEVIKYLTDKGINIL